MSFGFGVGDFLAVIKLANGIRRDFSDAPEQFQQITTEIRNLVIVLGDVDVSLAAHAVSEEQHNNLNEIRESCRSVLEDSRKELSKYLSLELKGRSLPERTKRACKRVKWEPDGVRDLRNRITANITALNAFTGANIRDTVFRLEDRQVQQENQEILEWLTPLDATAQQADFIRQRQAGTGQWLLNSIEYTRWKATKGEILFCHGIPGAGKTVLSSIVVDDLQDTFGIEANVAIGYIHFNFKRQGEQTLEKVLLSLLKQLSYTPTSVPDNVQALYNRCKSKGRRPNLEEVTKTLYSVAGLFSRVLIMVDALDECQIASGCQRELIFHLIELRRTTGVNILATSRPVPHIVEKFHGFPSLEVRASEGDINKYLESNLVNLPGFVSKDKKLQEEIKERIKEAVGGIFLLAKLHLDSLKGKRSPRALRQTLNTLATGNGACDEAYQNTLLRISGQLVDQKELAMSALMWIVHAKRPLRTIELQHALGVEVGEQELFEDSLPELNDLLSACCGLVTIDEQSHVIRLIHYTTQEFFDRHGARYFPDAEIQITDTCISYLAFDEFENGPCQTKEDWELRLDIFPLYGYACQFWGQHAHPRQDSEIIRKFLNLQGNVEACGQTLTILEHWHGRMGYFRWFDDMSKTTGLHLAAYFGLVVIINHILNDFINPDVLDFRCRTPMHYAARNGHQDVVNQLLENFGDLNVMDGDYQTPLHLAAKNGHKAIVRLFLDEGAQINLTDIDGQSPLDVAAGEGFESIVRLLLDTGAEVDLAKHGQSPLFSATVDVPKSLFNATVDGHEAVVRLLLDRSAKVDLMAEYGQSLLHLAAGYGHEAIVRLFLNEGAQINYMDAYGQTPLKVAAEKGSEAVVRLLLDEGAEVDLDEHGQTPLWLALRNGHEAVVRLLLEKGAQVDYTNEDGDKPLIIAAKEGKWQILELLLAAGADYTTTDIYGRSVLMYAAIRDSYEAVDILLKQNDLDLSARDHWGSTAISLAARIGNLAAFKKIAAMPSVDILARDHLGRTSLWWAQKQKYDDITREIVGHRRFTIRDTTEAHTPAVGEPMEFLRPGEDESCHVCFASTPGPWFCCIEGHDNAWRKLMICQECHGLGARCLIESHKLYIE